MTERKETKLVASTIQALLQKHYQKVQNGFHHRKTDDAAESFLQPRLFKGNKRPLPECDPSPSPKKWCGAGKNAVKASPRTGAVGSSDAPESKVALVEADAQRRLQLTKESDQHPKKKRKRKKRKGSNDRTACGDIMAPSPIMVQKPFPNKSNPENALRMKKNTSNQENKQNVASKKGPAKLKALPLAAATDNTRVSRVAILEKQRSLPIYPVRRELTRAVQQKDSIVLIGETACGKSTQVPQFLYKAQLNRSGIIAITQPRRVAAMTIAQRVALEMGTELGKLVGYSVRFDDMSSPSTKIKYLTDGMLLRESISDPLLKNYSIILLDEAHERTLHTDVLFGVVKSLQETRRQKQMTPLKIIIMSATMDVDHFSRYFNKAPVYYLEGRQHPIRMMYAVNKQEDYVFTALVTVFQIHRREPKGDILVFCTGQEEIESMVKAVKETTPLLPAGCPMLSAYPLYAALPSTLQLRVFAPTPEECRKVIFATNIAETSITIPGIKYVVDTGMVKARTFLPQNVIDILKVQRISKAQAWQRAGRAGREMSGVCYRLYTEQEYQVLPEHSIPEIQRCNLANAVLQLLAIGIRNVVHFDFMDKPSVQNLVSAIDQLSLLGAVEKSENWEDAKLTPLGRQMALFPLEPRYSKVILASKDLLCTEEALTVIAMLSVESVFQTPPEKQKELAAEVRKKFLSNEGDLITLLNVYRAFRHVSSPKQWCRENFLHFRNLKMAFEVRQQLRQLCVDRAGIVPKSCGRNTESLRKCLATGLFMNIAELMRDGTYLTLDTGQKVSIHPSSCLFLSKSSHVIYTELVQTAKCYMRNLCVVNPEWLPTVFPSDYQRKSGRDKEKLKVIGQVQGKNATVACGL